MPSMTAPVLHLVAVIAIAGCGSGGSVPGVDAGAPDPGSDAAAPDAATGTPDAGPARADAAAPSSDPADPGAFAAHVADGLDVPVGDDTATLTVCSPSSDGGVSPAPGPFPLVVVSPGFQLPRSQYASMCEHLATWGYVTLLQDYAGGGGIFDAPGHRELAEGVGAILDWALGDASGFAARIDGDAIATAGHSLGGKVSIFAAILDPRIDVVVGWDPVDAVPPGGDPQASPSVAPELMDDLDVPLAVLGETLDGSGSLMACAPTGDNYAAYFDSACASPDALEVTIAGADHMDWVDDRSSCGLTCSFCQTGTTDDARTRAITRGVTVAFLDNHLRGADTDAYLDAPGPEATLRTSPPCE